MADKEVSRALTKHNRWPATTLAEYITAALTRPFEWGTHDCVLFAARWLEYQTGKDYLSDLPKWSTKEEAEAILKEGGGLQKMVDERLERVDVNYAVEGDLAFHQDALRLFSGGQICGPSESGLLFFSRMEAICAWRCA